ncbi:MAG: hypothetical protein Q8K75_09575 [Chlamydiales bacterium]|nr:hypothetical protein [Chlamydiales bacterium]
MRSTLAFTLASLFMIFSANLQGFEGKRWDRKGLQKYAKDLHKRNGRFQTAEGCFNRKKRECVSVTFKSDQMVELEEARRLFVPEVQKAIAMLGDNQSKSILQTNGPFEPSSLSYMLAFQRTSGEYYPPPFIALIIFANEKISYETRKASGIGFCEICEESFEEAIEILNREANTEVSCGEHD